MKRVSLAWDRAAACLLTVLMGAVAGAVAVWLNSALFAVEFTKIADRIDHDD
jgi:hypothetical protein